MCRTILSLYAVDVTQRRKAGERRVLSVSWSVDNGEPDEAKVSRPVRREGWGNTLIAI
jgi:hypothetical protein